MSIDPDHPAGPFTEGPSAPERPSNPAEPAHDRKLGDEWADWDGDLRQSDARMPARSFLVLAAAGLGLALAATWVTIWLVAPRLAMVHPVLPSLLAGSATLMAMAWLAALLGASAGVVWLTTLLRGLGGLRWILPLALWVGHFLGLTRDQVGNAYLQIHNRVARPTRVSEPSRLLVLLPRCLGREAMETFRRLREQYGFIQVVAVGGNEARQAIARHRPEAIVAVACERDLLAGLRDLRDRVPIAAFTNLRPEGPCKNTVVDLPAITQTVRVFLGRSSLEDDTITQGGKDL